ncbi:1-acyl-sn-glycerol-3-phosphate acyltransferase [Candidatus Dependentiae bacterium]|nr:MAG: 1-acyl-sn-glycerol-3-phosphate acyltransferase [Candidatus Dependentiae bacterium]
MKSIVVLLHTFLVRFLLFFICIPLIPVVLVASCLSPFNRFSSTFLFKIIDFFYTVVLRCLLIPITYKWISKIPNEPAIIIANHQSSLDIVLIGIVFKGSPHIWLARSELMDTFLLRWILAIFAQVIDVHNARTTAVTLRKVITLASQTNAHIVLFPEGSRSSTGKLQPFFDGYILLAKKLKRPVVPIYIHNLCNVYPRGSFFIKRVPVDVTVGPAFFLSDYNEDQQFKKTIQDWFAAKVTNASTKNAE